MRQHTRRHALPSRGLAGAGFSLVEVLVAVIVILIIAAIAIPRYLQARMTANEAAAVSALRTLATAETNYFSSYGQGYAPDLASLGPPPPGVQVSASHADLIDSVFASGIRGGYSFVYTPVDLSGSGKADQYAVNANPVSPGQTGEMYFYLDQTNVVRQERGKAAGPASPPVPK